MYDCYDNIVGLSSSDCACTEDNRPTNYNESASGLFLDELANISRLVALGECAAPVWDILEKALSGGVKQFVADTNALLGKKYKLKRKAVSGQVLGQIKSPDIFTPSKNYAVLTLSCAPVRGGFMRLRKIGGVFSQAGAVTVDLYNNVDGLLSSHPITTVADRHATTAALNIELPLYSKYLQPLQYYFVYQFDELNPPKDTSLTCGCGGWSPTYNTSNPYYNNINSHRAAPWSDYVMVGGREINSLDELEDEVESQNNTMFGLTLEVDFGCKVNEVLCEESMDFIGNPLALSMALAIQYAAGIKVANEVQKSALITWENMVQPEEWDESILEWQTKYNEHVNFIVAQADYTTNDCLACNNVMGLARKGLFA